MTSPHPTPEGTTIYYWSNGLLLLAPTLIVERPSNPLGATLRIACGEPYVIEVDGKPVRTRASLLGPKVGRRRVEAIHSDIAVFYLPIDAPENADLKKMLGDHAILNLDIERFATLVPALKRAFAGDTPAAEVRTLVRQAVQAITGTEARPRKIDARIVKALRLLEALPLNRVSLEHLSEKLHLSPSRLRELFKQETGSTIGDTARWLAVWRMATLWQQGRLLTDIAQEAGFYDLAHFDRAFVEVFGINPLTATDPQYVRLIRCE